MNESVDGIWTIWNIIHHLLFKLAWYHNAPEFRMWELYELYESNIYLYEY